MVDNELLAWMYEVDEEPGTKPLLVASTVWRNKGGEIVQIPALLDTGCNTSIILRSLLGKLLSVDGTVPKVKILLDATADSCVG